MRPQEDGLVGVDFTENQREVVLVPENVLVRVQLPHAWLFANRDRRLDAPRNQLLIAASVGDELLDSNELDSMFSAEFLELGHARHGAVSLHELRNHAGRI